MWKKIVLLILVISLISISPSFASSARYGTQKAQPIETTGIVNDADGNPMDYGVWIYSIAIFADASNSFMGIYDCDTLAELQLTTTYAKDEIGEATQYDTEKRIYSPPVYFSDGVAVVIFTGVGFVEYGPPPPQ